MSEINSGAYEKTDKLNSAGTALAANFVLSNQAGKDKKMTITQLATFMSTNLGAISATSITVTTASATNINLANDLTVTEAGNIIVGTTTGTQIGTASGQKISIYGGTPVVKGAALTAIDATVIDATYGADELGVLSNVRVRLNEFEARMQAFGPIN